MSRKNSLKARLKIFFLRKLYNIRHPEISARLSLWYGTCCFLTIVAVDTLIGLGVYKTLYQQAERSLQISIRLTIEKIHSGEQIFQPVEGNFYVDRPIMPSVILRAVDENGTVFFDTDPKFPTLPSVISRERAENPFWAPTSEEDQFLINPPLSNFEVKDDIYPIHATLRVADFERSYVYHATVKTTYNQQPITLHFFRTITSEKLLFADLQRSIIWISLGGFLISLVVGWFLSKRLLKPIRTITRTANRIAIEKMDERIPTSRRDDELSDLIDAFNRMITRLQTGIEQQKKFVSDASHELRTPLTVISGYSDLLTRWGAEDEEILNEAILAIKSESENMQDLVEKLLMSARIDQKRQPVKKVEFEFQDLLGDVMTKMKLVEKDHEVIFERNDDGKIFADKTLIRQLLRIFLDNASKYTPSGGKIFVESVLKTVDENFYLQVTIKDTGIGIDEKDIGKIFDRFYRVDRSRTKLDDSGKEIGGNGLGLSIAKWIMEEHGIEVKIDSKINVGTSFILKIPCV